MLTKIKECLFLLLFPLDKVFFGYKSLFKFYFMVVIDISLIWDEISSQSFDP